MDFIYKNSYLILESTGFTLFLLSFMIFFTFLKKKYERSYNLAFFYFPVASVFIVSLFLFLAKLKNEDLFSWSRLRGGDLQIFLFTILFLIFLSLTFLSFFLLSEKKNLLPKKIAIFLTVLSFFLAGYREIFLNKTFNKLLISFSIIILSTIFVKKFKRLEKYPKHLILISLFLTISFFGLSEEVMKVSKNPLSLSKKKIVTPEDCGCLNCHSENFFKNFKFKDRGKFRLFMLTNNVDEMKNLKVPPQVIDKLAKSLIKENNKDEFFNHFFQKGCFNCHIPTYDKNKISTGGGFLDFRKYPEEQIKNFLLKKELGSNKESSKCMKNYNLSKKEIKMILNYIYKK